VKSLAISLELSRVLRCLNSLRAKLGIRIIKTTYTELSTMASKTWGDDRCESSVILGRSVSLGRHPKPRIAPLRRDLPDRQTREGLTR
jgi:hypothetical protein